MMRKVFAVLFLSFSVVSRLAADCCSVAWTPLPAVAGEPIQVTYHGIGFGCQDIGTLEVRAIEDHQITLDAEPPGCPILPPPLATEYTATTTLPPLQPGTYQILILEVSGDSVLGPRELATLPVFAPPACQATDTALCLNSARFEVTAEWRDFAGRKGAAHAVPPGADRAGIGASGLLWFFRPDNHEVLVKVLNGCDLNDHYWVFISAATTVEYELVVRDVESGETRSYSKPLGSVPLLTADTTAFPCALEGPPHS